MKRVFARSLTMLSLLSMLLSLLPETTVAAPPRKDPPPVVQTATDSSLNKLSPDLRQPALDGGSAQQRVLVIAGPDTDWQGLLQQRITRKLDLGGLRLTSGWSTQAALLKLAGLEGVHAVLGTHPALYPPADETPADRAPAVLPGEASSGETLSGTEIPRAGSDALELWHARDVVGASQANAAGYDGRGVIVSVNDTGVDFAHPDLQGTQARASDLASPYYGWPLVADAQSILTYLESGGNTAGSNYADTTSTFSYTVGSATGSARIFNGVATHTVFFTNTSKSGVYHYGWHPDFSLDYLESNVNVSPMVLLVDEHTAGVYDTVYVDLGDGHNLTYDFRRARPAQRGSEEVWADLTGDGVADISGGMIYWIADGAHWMPGTEALFDVSSLTPPAAGSMVAFFGDYNSDSHGTSVASQIAAQGVINSQYGQGASVPNLPGVTSGQRVIGGVLRGMAPKARLFAASWNDGYDNWFLAALGYDGIPGTSDDAQIISNSWGYTNIQIGWDYASRLATYISTVINPQTTIVAAAGNGGFGYGVMDTNGASSSILTVGASTQYGTSDAASIIADVFQITADDVTYYSSRGPNGLGQIKPQVLCPGNSATGAYPLNLSTNPRTSFYDGQNAWYVFGGTSQATPLCAGVLADVIQAYRQRTDQWPSYVEAGQLLMNGADNINYDVLSQGAGRANAYRSALVAAGGTSISPAQWNAGGYRGTSYEAFSNVMFAGTTAGRTFTVTNWNQTTPVTLSLRSDYLIKSGEIITTFTSQPVATESAYLLRKPDYLFRIDPLIPTGTDLMQIDIDTSYGEFSLGDPTDPASQAPRGDNAWYTRIYNWTDWNDNRILWSDSNRNVVVDPGELDMAAIDPLSGNPINTVSLELNPLNEGNNSANTNQLRVQKPLERMNSGLWLGLTHRVRTDAQPQTHFQIRYTFYRHASWPWLTTAAPTVIVPPGSTRAFSATMSVPAGSPLGLYEGALLARADSGGATQTTVIPVVVNVAANGPSFSVRPRANNQVFDNNRMSGGYDWRGNGWVPQGDWRTFFADVPDTTAMSANSTFLIQASWVVTPTDIDIFAFSPAPHDPSLLIPGAIAGPYDLAQSAASEQTVHSTGTGRAYTFDTPSGRPEEMISARMRTGLNEFLFHNVLYNGPASGEPFTVSIGAAAVNPAAITTLATRSSVTLPMTYSGSIALAHGLSALGFGLSAPTVYDNQFVAQAASKYYTFTVSAAGRLRLETEPVAANYDIDLSLERLIGAIWTPVAQSGGPDANESIEVLRPADGQYRARVSGYSVPGPASKFRLTVDIVQGGDVTVSGLPGGPIAAGATVTFTLHLDNLSFSGSRQGLLFIGPAELPTAFTIPITVIRPENFIHLPVIISNR